MNNKHLIVDGLDIRYAEQGSGPVILLLHGWGTSLETFNELLGEMRGVNARFISLDLPGFGESEPPKDAWDISNYTKFVRLFLDKLSIGEPDIIVGHSFGGRIAIKAVANNLIKPKRLVLLSSAGMAKRSSFRNVFFTLVTKAGKFISFIPPFHLFRKALKNKLYKVTGSTDYLGAGKMRETFKKIIRENLVSDARDITAPTLLVWGDEDTETPLAEAHALKDVISGATLEILEGGDHFAHQKRAKEVAEKISKFIKL